MVKGLKPALGAFIILRSIVWYSHNKDHEGRVLLIIHAAI